MSSNHIDGSFRFTLQTVDLQTQSLSMTAKRLMR